MNPIITIPKHRDCFKASEIAAVRIDGREISIILTHVAPLDHFIEYKFASNEEASAAHLEIVKQWKDAL